MKRLRKLSLFVAVITWAVSFAQADVPIQWKPVPGWEQDSAYCRLYDAKRVVTLRGTIQRVEKVVPLKGMGSGIHFILATDTETIPVQLGPTWFVDAQPVQLHADDAVDVTGSRVPCDGKDVIMAAEVKRGKEVARFRKLQGSPLWVGVKH